MSNPTETHLAAVQVRNFKVGRRLVRYCRTQSGDEREPYGLELKATVRGVSMTTTYYFAQVADRDREFERANQELAERYLTKLLTFTNQWTHKPSL